MDQCSATKWRRPCLESLLSLLLFQVNLQRGGRISPLRLTTAFLMVKLENLKNFYTVLWHNCRLCVCGKKCVKTKTIEIYKQEQKHFLRPNFSFFIFTVERKSTT